MQKNPGESMEDLELIAEEYEDQVEEKIDQEMA